LYNICITSIITTSRVMRKTVIAYVILDWFIWRWLWR